MGATKHESEKRGGVNGAARPAMTAGTLAAAGGAAFFYDDPMSRVLGMDAKTSGLRAWFGYTSGSTALLGLLMALASLLAWARSLHAADEWAIPAEIDVQKEEAPPPPPEKPKDEAPPSMPPPRAIPRDAPPPPPAPAQAAKVLTREPDPNEPVDLTGNTIVQGNADSYAGGFTASNGKDPNAVRSLPSPTAGVVGGAGPVQGAGPDRTRAASLGGGNEWSCPFPPEADTAQMDEAYVTLQVDVRADGSAAAVRVLNDPGNGFGREARRCALATRYATALDRDGKAIQGTTKAFRVHFSR